MRETVRRERVRRSRALLAVVPVAVFVLILGGSLAYLGLSDGDGSADEHGLENGSGDLWLANGDGSGETRLLGGDEDDSWAPRSPDGRRIALLRDSRLAIINADGTSLRRLTGCGELKETRPNRSPDGSHIAITRDPGSMLVIDPDGPHLARVPIDGWATGLAWERPT